MRGRQARRAVVRLVSEKASRRHARILGETLVAATVPGVAIDVAVLFR